MIFDLSEEGIEEGAETNGGEGKGEDWEGEGHLAKVSRKEEEEEEN